MDPPRKDKAFKDIPLILGYINKIIHISEEVNNLKIEVNKLETFEKYGDIILTKNISKEIVYLLFIRR